MHANGILKTLTERTEETRTAKVLAFGRQRVASAADSLNRAGASAASAQLCNEAVAKLIALVYAADDTGLCNIDTESGRLLISAPWGRNGRYDYGLRATEADALRMYMQRLLTVPRPIPLFTYDNRNWYLNAWDYRSGAAALDYWKSMQMTGTHYKQFADTMRKKRTGGA